MIVQPTDFYWNFIVMMFTFYVLEAYMAHIGQCIFKFNLKDATSYSLMSDKISRNVFAL